MPQYYCPYCDHEWEGEAGATCPTCHAPDQFAV